jgi:hypothetical protein
MGKSVTVEKINSMTACWDNGYAMMYVVWTARDKDIDKSIMICGRATGQSADIAWGLLQSL